LTSKVGQNDLAFVCDQGSLLVGMCMQDYESLYATVTICVTLVNIQTDTDRQTHSLYE